LISSSDGYDETHGFGTGFGGKGYSKLQAYLGLPLGQRIAAFHISECELRTAIGVSREASTPALALPS